MSKAGDRILRSARRARDFARGENADDFVVHVPEHIDVRAIRERLSLSRQQFAQKYGFAETALKEWEQGRRQPDRSARVLLKVIDHDHSAVERALAAA